MKKRTILARATLSVGALTVIAAARPAAPPPVGGVRALTVLPGQTVTIEGYGARATAGRLAPLGRGRWAWTAPPTPGLYPIKLVAPDGGEGDSVTVQAFVVVPFDGLRGEVLNGYRIGSYPAKPRGVSSYSLPVGFVEVTPENENVFVSAHFRLKQFLCKQPAGSRRYVVLNERLLVALEYVLERVRAAGYRATTLNVMSGYRTPAYNKALGNVRFSQHQLGSAADIFIDENGDGRMDDLNGDGRSDIRDAEVLYRIIDDASARPKGQGLIGGIGKYPPTAAHGPFVHVDVRPGHARW
jgi:hypothetical protein